MNPLPDPGVVADVVLDGGWRRHVHVHGTVEGGRIVIRPFDGPAVLPGTLLWCPAALEWREGHRAARVDGIITLADGAFALTPISAPHTMQRRRFVRVPAEITAALVAQDRRLMTRTVNVSVGGMLVADATDLPVDAPLRFALELGAETVTGEGRVVRGAPDGTRGVVFSPLEGRAERALSRFVSERQRRLAAVG